MKQIYPISVNQHMENVLTKESKENMGALLKKGGETTYLGLEIIQGDLDRAMEVIEAHPLWIGFETKRDDFVIETPEGGYWDNGHGTHFCCDCLDGAMRQARWEYRAEGKSRNRFDTDGCWSNLSEADDFETCAVCGAYFEYTPLFSWGFGDWNYSIDHIRDASAEMLHELHEVLESNCNCVFYHDTYKNERFRATEVIKRWEIAKNVIKAFEGGYGHVKIPSKPQPFVCKEFAGDFYEINWENREQLLKKWGMDYNPLYEMLRNGAVIRLTAGMCIDVAKFSGKAPSYYYRLQFQENHAGRGKPSH